MNIKSLLAILFLFTFYNHAWAAECTAPPLTLEDNKWELISLPCNPQRTDSVTDVFGEELGVNDYDATWVVYSWDGSKPGYVKMPAKGGGVASDFLRQGHGYWIIQVTGKPVELSMPQNAVATEPPRCSDNATTKTRCIDISPTANDGKVGWTMLGNPYNENFSVDRLRIKAFASGLVPPDAPGQVGSSLGEAQEKRVFNAEVFRYNGKGYDKLSGSGTLSIWDGFWGATLEDAHGRETKLRFTKEP
jgi:hypothetical protein